MALKQISVLIENTRGSLVRVTDALAARGVNIRALSMADTEHFGILRMILTDNRVAEEILKELGVITQETEVIGVKIGDQPGKLSAALHVLAEADINIEYLYAFFARTERHAYVVIRVADNAQAEKVLTDAGFYMISDEDIGKL